MSATTIVQIILREIGYFDYVKSKEGLSDDTKKRMDVLISVCGELNDNTYTSVLSHEAMKNQLDIDDPVFIDMCNKFRYVYKGMNLKTEIEPNEQIKYSFQ